MFSNLIMGTLFRFQKDEKKIQNVEKIQAEKYKEAEKRLEDKKREDRDKIMAERKNYSIRVVNKKKMRALLRKKALIQYAEAKKEHYKLLRNFIQTQAKPTLFFAPAKHSVRSLKLLKAPEKAIDGLMELRQKELERELENHVDDEHHEQNTAESNDAEERIQPVGRGIGEGRLDNRMSSKYSVVSTDYIFLRRFGYSLGASRYYR